MSETGVGEGEPVEATDATGKTLLLTNDRIGRGDHELGRILMRNFLYTLARSDAKPDAVLLSNDGVRLACEGSESLDDLRLLHEAGVSIRACGTCLDFLHLKESLAVGEVGTMPGLVDAVMMRDGFVTLG